jgi:hypothetical protein
MVSWMGPFLKMRGGGTVGSVFWEINKGYPPFFLFILVTNLVIITAITTGAMRIGDKQQMNAPPITY